MNPYNLVVMHERNNQDLLLPAGVGTIPIESAEIDS